MTGRVGGFLLRSSATTVARCVSSLNEAKAETVISIF